MIQKRIELKVWIFIIAALVLISSFFVFIAYKKDMFSRVYTYTLLSKSGEGFSVGMPLKFSGFIIGTVKSLELNESGMVIAKVRVPERHIKWLRQDSILILDRPLIGAPKITVFTENLQSPVLSTDSLKEIYPVDSINDAVQKIEPLLEKIDVILDNTARITGSLAGKETLLEMAVGDKDAVQSIINTLKKSEDMGRHVVNIIEKIDTTSSKLDQNLFGPGGTFTLVHAILKDVLAKLEKLDTVVQNVSQTSTDVTHSTRDLEKLRNDLDTAMDSVNELLYKIERILPSQKKKDVELP